MTYGGGLNQPDAVVELDHPSDQATEVVDVQGAEVIQVEDEDVTAYGVVGVYVVVAADVVVREDVVAAADVVVLEVVVRLELVVVEDAVVVVVELCNMISQSVPTYPRLHVLTEGLVPHVPSPLAMPDSHLQLDEHPSPFTRLPSSHSSPRDGSQ